MTAEECGELLGELAAAMATLSCVAERLYDTMQIMRGMFDRLIEESARGQSA